MAHANLVILALGVVANFVLGIIWHADSVMGKRWSATYGIDPAKLPGGTVYPVAMMLGVVKNWVALLALDFVAAAAVAPPSWGTELSVVFWLWVGFTAAPLASHSVFTHYRAWVSSVLIDGVFHLIQLFALVAIRRFF